MRLNVSSCDDFDEHKFSALSMEMKEWISFSRKECFIPLCVWPNLGLSLSEQGRVALLQVSKRATGLEREKTALHHGSVSCDSALGQLGLGGLKSCYNG